MKKNSEKAEYNSALEALGEETSSNATTQPELIATDVADFEINTYNSGYITTKGDCYLLGYNSWGQLGLGNTNSPTTSYSKVSFEDQENS